MWLHSSAVTAVEQHFSVERVFSVKRVDKNQLRRWGKECMRRTQTLDCQTGAFSTCLALQPSHISFHHPSIIPFWNKGRPATFIWGVVPLSFYWMSANLVYTSPWCFLYHSACGWERRNRVRERVCSFSTVSINLRWTERKKIHEPIEIRCVPLLFFPHIHLLTCCSG